MDVKHKGCKISSLPDRKHTWSMNMRWRKCLKIIKLSMEILDFPRLEMDSSDWKLKLQNLIIICQTLGALVLDLFASRSSNQLTLKQRSGCEATREIDPRDICMPFYQSKSTSVKGKSASCWGNVNTNTNTPTSDSEWSEASAVDDLRKSLSFMKVFSASLMCQYLKLRIDLDKLIGWWSKEQVLLWHNVNHRLFRWTIFSRYE